MYQLPKNNLESDFILPKRQNKKLKSFKTAASAEPLFAGLRTKREYLGTVKIQYNKYFSAEETRDG